MALFGKKNNPEKETPAQKTVQSLTNRATSDVIVRPRLSEKALSLSERGVYTFIVRRDATKRAVAAAVKDIYAVSPRQVRIVNRAPALRRSGARRRFAARALRKAYVYLKAGDTISLA
jgi:ribosomal protein L23